MITSADQDSLQRIVGATTFSRGKRYAERDAVKARRWEDGGTRVVGEVQGSASESYRVSATVTRSGGQRLSGIRASCTCPVGINCKHAVALLLSADSSAGGAAAFGQQTRDGGEWTAAPRPQHRRPQHRRPQHRRRRC